MKPDETNNNSIFFGAFTSNPKLFSFNRGERKLLMEISYQVKNMVESGNEKLYVTVPKSGNSLSFVYMVRTPHGTFFGQSKLLSTTSADESTKDKQKQKLVDQVSQIWNAHENLEIKNIFCAKSIDFNLLDQKSGATISCIFCGKDVINGKFKVNSRQTESGWYWILSNLTTHIKKQHLTVCDTKQKSNSPDMNRKDSDRQTDEENTEYKLYSK